MSALVDELFATPSKRKLAAALQSQWRDELPAGHGARDADAQAAS